MLLGSRILYSYKDYPDTHVIPHEPHVRCTTKCPKVPWYNSEWQNGKEQYLLTDEILIYDILDISVYTLLNSA
jgi:hypothetical protein